MDNETRRKLIAEIDKTLALLDKIESRAKNQNDPMDDDENSI